MELVMIKTWNTQDIKDQIDALAFAESDPRMDGFTTWTCKKELYMLYWYVEKKLDACSTYTDEDTFVEEHQLDEMWEILKDTK